MFNRMTKAWVLACLLAIPPAHAQFAVIDVGAITQLIAQAKTLESQLLVAQENLAGAQAEFASISGGRGMERLLSGAPRNYLPTDWASLQSAMQGGGAYGTLSAGVTASVSANSVLSPQQLAVLAADLQSQITTERRLAALRQNLAREALSTTSSRFTALQQFISTLPAAADQKAVLDLQTRVATESAMLQNEQTKLQTLNQVLLAEELAAQEQARERAIAGQGQFSSRFQPRP
jgi:type IV secretion system protein VirB5